MQSYFTAHFESSSLIYSGCLKYGYKMVSEGLSAGSRSNMTECQSACKLDSDCQLFEWDHDHNMCKFIKEPSAGKFDITKSSNVLIGIPNCENIKENEMWLKMNYVEFTDPVDQTVPKSNDKKINKSKE